jgi:hypothetical protein
MGSNIAKGKFEVTDWDEKPYAQIGEGGKLTKASVKGNLTGDIVGEALTEWLMCYASKDEATFFGFQKIDGTISGKKGSFVIEMSGTFNGKVAESTWSVVPGSGSGELAGLSGEGTFLSPHGTKADYSLEYEIATVRAGR